jgi:methionyl-tRNA formyltransferase
VSASILSQYQRNLVMHESELPKGKGCSCLCWQILEGENKFSVTVTLFEAAKKVDSGGIYAHEWLEFDGHERIGELRAVQTAGDVNPLQEARFGISGILAKAWEQVGKESYYPRRKSADSRLNTSQSIIDRYALLGILEQQAVPGISENEGHEYMIAVRKISQH